MPTINTFQKPTAGIGAVADLVKTVSGVRDLIQNPEGAKTDALNLENKKTQMALDLATKQTAANQDPNTPESAINRMGGSLVLSSIRDAQGVNPNDTKHPLNQMIQKVSDPNTPGYFVNTLMQSPQVKDQMEITKTKLQGVNATNAANARSAPQYARLEEQKNENSIGAGKEFENDPIIKLSKTNLNSLTKSQSILDNPNKPVTTKDLNLAYNDYINSVAAGGTATEGKITRELPETWATDFNTLKGKAGQFDDLRQNPTGQALINQLKENISTVRHDMASAISDQAGNIYQNYASSTNPKVQSIAKQKLKAYSPDKYAQFFGGAAPQQSYTSSNIQSQVEPPHGPTVQQNGHTYTWNPKSQKYEAGQ